MGADAWAHLEQSAGATMAVFLDRYVHYPIQSLLAEAPTSLPKLVLAMDHDHLVVTVGDETLEIQRNQGIATSTEGEPLPNDVDTHLPSP